MENIHNKQYRIDDQVIEFFSAQHFAIVSTIDQHGFPHTSCKGIIELKNTGEIHLLDLYYGMTYRNIQKNSLVSVSCVDEHQFRGYCLKGHARIQMPPIEALHAWEQKIVSRITKRVLKNIAGNVGHGCHPEMQLPKPSHMIVVSVFEVVDLHPQDVKEE